MIADVLEVAETAFGAERVHVMGESIGGTIALAAGLAHPARFASVAMSNAAIKGGQIAHAPGWRAEIARVGIKGWSDRLMEMRFVPGTVPPEALAWFASVQEKSPPHVAIGLGELLVGTDLASQLSGFKLPLLLMMPDRSPYVSLAQANTLAELVPQARDRGVPRRTPRPAAVARQGGRGHAARVPRSRRERRTQGPMSGARTRPTTTYWQRLLDDWPDGIKPAAALSLRLSGAPAGRAGAAACRCGSCQRGAAPSPR